MRNDEIVQIRLSAEEKAAWCRKARRSGMTLSSWIRERCGVRVDGPGDPDEPDWIIGEESRREESSEEDGGDVGSPVYPAGSLGFVQETRDEGVDEGGVSSEGG